MNKYFKIALLVSAVSMVSMTAQAHRAWLLPSATVLSGSDSWITVDAAISNDLFYFEHHPLQLDNLSLLGPDGKPSRPQIWQKGNFAAPLTSSSSNPAPIR